MVKEMKVKDHLHINIIQKCLEAFLIIKKKSFS
jgi:hypothetical protein